MKEVLIIALLILGYSYGTLFSLYKVAKAFILTAKCNVEVEGTLVSVEKLITRESTVGYIASMYQCSNTCMGDAAIRPSPELSSGITKSRIILLVEKVKYTYQTRILSCAYTVSYLAAMVAMI